MLITRHVKILERDSDTKKRNYIFMQNTIKMHTLVWISMHYFKNYFLESRNTSIDINKARAKVFAHLISMPIQLKYLLVEKIEWLYHIIQYVRALYNYLVSFKTIVRFVYVYFRHRMN